jgi:hypothetical protein
LIELVENAADVVVVLGHLGACVSASGLVHEIGMRAPEVIPLASVVGEERLLGLGVALDEVDHAISHIGVHRVIEFQGEGSQSLLDR